MADALKEVESTQKGRRSDVTILDVFGEVASIKIDAITRVDYLHVAKVAEEWKIINVLAAEARRELSAHGTDHGMDGRGLVTPERGLVIHRIVTVSSLRAHPRS
ncbi:MAG: nuclear transport factor 2 family protein [Gemmatimonadota bacterium]|nr:MAG: nuclear transport factor 2 family protein [Gemmatimonadota bacterium]